MLVSKAQPNAAYQVLREAILGKTQVVCSYHGYEREICPHVIGLNAKGQEQVLAFQFGGGSSSGLPAGTASSS